MKSRSNCSWQLLIWLFTLPFLSACISFEQSPSQAQMLQWVYIGLWVLALVTGRLMGSWTGYRYPPIAVGLYIAAVIVGSRIFGFHLSWLQAALLSIGYLIGYFSYRLSRIVANLMTKGVNEYDQAQAILRPLRERYYRLGYQLTLNEQEIINSQRDQLEYAIDLLNTARLSRLRAGETGRRDAIVALREIGLTHRLLGNFSQARTDFQKAYAEMQQLYSEYRKDDHHRPRLAQSLGVFCLDIGEVECFSGNLIAATEWYERAIDFANEAGDQGHLQIANRLLTRIQNEHE